MLPSISRLFLRWGGKVYSQLDGESWPEFLPVSATDAIRVTAYRPV